MTAIPRRTLAVLAVSSLAVTSLVACGSDEPADSSTTPATAVTSPSAPTTSAAPSSVTPSATPAPTKTTTSAPTPPPASPTDDENGEEAGDLIIEYPGAPLKRTTSTTPDPHVEDVQIRLVEVGYTVDTDGIFDAGTEAVVKKFQAAKGLKADGIVGQATWSALFRFDN